MKNFYKFTILVMLALCCWSVKELHDAKEQIQALKHFDACVCDTCLEESFQTVDDLQEAVDAVLSFPDLGSATRLYRTAWEYIEAKDGIEGSQEFCDAIEDNIRFGSHLDDLAAVVAAIRYHENGSHQAVLTNKQVLWLKPGETWACDISYGSFGTWGCGYSDKAKESGLSGYRLQAGDCAMTVQNNWDRYLTASGDSRDIHSFIRFLGGKYCPVGSRNDNGDNKYWISGVTREYDGILNLSK